MMSRARLAGDTEESACQGLVVGYEGPTLPPLLFFEVGYGMVNSLRRPHL